MFNAKLNNTNTIFNSFIYIIFAGIISFLIGYIHHKYIYSIMLPYHGDSGAYYDLAKSILAERSLLVHDFYYGNQLMIFKVSPFIAISMYFGLTGFKAFLIGSSLYASVMGIILYIFVNILFKNNRKSLLFTFLLLLPISTFEANYVLGEQSHLFNVIISLCIVVCSYKYIQDSSHKYKNYYLFAAAVMLFLISFESPIRGAFIAIPLLFTICILSDKKYICSFIVITLFTLFIAFLFNRYLITIYTITADHITSVSFIFFNNIFKNTVQIIKNMYYDGFSNLLTLKGFNINAFRRMIIILNSLSIVIFLIFILAQIKNLITVTKNKIYGKENDLNNFIVIVAITGILSGAILVILFNPDSARHFLWAIFILKFCVLCFATNLLKNIFNENKFKQCLVLFVVTMLISNWTAKYSVFGSKIKNLGENLSNSDVIKDANIVANKYSIKYMYGVSLGVTPFNIFVPNVNVGFLNHVGFGIAGWLTTTSYACRSINEKVLYLFFRNDIEKHWIEKLRQNSNNFEAKTGDGYSIWIGNPIWEMPEHCKNMNNNK